jgi:hypothetical protein
MSSGTITLNGGNLVILAAIVIFAMAIEYNLFGPKKMPERPSAPTADMGSSDSEADEDCHDMPQDLDHLAITFQ